MATFGKDGYLYVRKPTPKKEFLVKCKGYKGYIRGYVMQHIHSIDTPKDMVGKKVRIKLEIVA